MSEALPRWQRFFRRAAARIWAVIGAVSVGTKIMGIVLGLVLLLGVGVTAQVRIRMAEALGHELDERGISIARDLAARSTDLILTSDLFALHELLRDTVAHNEDLRYAFVLDSQGRVLVHSFGVGVPPDLLGVNPVSGSERYRLQILESEEGQIHDVAVPVLGGHAGTVRVGLSEHRLQAQLAAITYRLLLITFLIALAGVAGGYLLTWVLTRPVRALVEATRTVARGELDHRAPVWAEDELGALARSFNAMVEEQARLWEALKQREARRGQLLEQVITAQEEERRRIARELHDQTGQSLTSILVGLRNLESDPSPARLNELKAIVADTLDGVRRLALELRPSILDDLGLVPALERYVQTCASRYHLTVDLQTVGLDGVRLPPAVETALYRIIQEAMTNVVRHAQARQVSLLLEVRGGAVVAVVEDDGCGFDAERLMNGPLSERCLGLHGMRERAELVGGTLTVESSPGAGTSVFVEVPLDGRGKSPGASDGGGKDSGAHCR
ncbi:MAG: ATP-binding protein [Chloroflexia bacterium]